MTRYLNRLVPSSIGTAVDDAGRCLMIRRTKDPYIGMWAMPGGKIEVGEHPDETVIREFYEETGLSTVVSKFAGVVSEVVPEPDGISHFLMYVFRLQVVGGQLTEGEEGPLRWLSPAEIQSGGIPSDAFITSDMIYADTDSGPHLVTLSSTEHAFTIRNVFR